MYNTNKYSDEASFDALWSQVEGIGRDVMALSEKHPEGIHLLGIQTYNIYTYIYIYIYIYI